MPLIDAAAAGELLHVPASWVLAQARAERIPHVRLGRYVRFDADELEAWWQTRRRGPIARSAPQVQARAPRSHRQPRPQ
jgi:excisionase family DNA binding protein